MQWDLPPQLSDQQGPSAGPGEEQGVDGGMEGTQTAGVPLSALLRHRAPESLGISSESTGPSFVLMRLL